MHRSTFYAKKPHHLHLLFILRLHFDAFSLCLRRVSLAAVQQFQQIEPPPPPSGKGSHAYQDQVNVYFPLNAIHARSLFFACIPLFRFECAVWNSLWWFHFILSLALPFSRTNPIPPHKTLGNWLSISSRSRVVSHNRRSKYVEKFWNEQYQFCADTHTSIYCFSERAMQFAFIIRFYRVVCFRSRRWWWWWVLHAIFRLPSYHFIHPQTKMTFAAVLWLCAISIAMEWLFNISKTMKKIVGNFFLPRRFPFQQNMKLSFWWIAIEIPCAHTLKKQRWRILIRKRKEGRKKFYAIRNGNIHDIFSHLTRWKSFHFHLLFDSFLFSLGFFDFTQFLRSVLNSDSDRFLFYRKKEKICEKYSERWALVLIFSLVCNSIVYIAAHPYYKCNIIQTTNLNVESICASEYFWHPRTLCPATEIKCRITTIPSKNPTTNLTKPVRKCVTMRMRGSMYLLVCAWYEYIWQTA